MTTNSTGREQVTVYTVGHSTRSLDELLAMLRFYDVRTLVDVRTVPRSRDCYTGM